MVLKTGEPLNYANFLLVCAALAQGKASQGCEIVWRTWPMHRVLVDTVWARAALLALIVTLSCTSSSHQFFCLSGFELRVSPHPLLLLSLGCRMARM